MNLYLAFALGWLACGIVSLITSTSPRRARENLAAWVKWLRESS